MNNTQLFMVASSLTYTTILSIVPLLAVSFSIFQAFGGLETLLIKIQPLILDNLAQGTGEQLMTTIQKMLHNIHAGALGAGGLVGLFFTSFSMLQSAENAINRVWSVKNKRTLFQKISSYWLFITLGPLAMAFIVGAATSNDLQLTRVFPAGTGGYLLTAALFLAAYKWIPSRKVHWVSAAIPAVVTTTLWNLAKWGYGLYTSKAVSYDKIYGSLGAIPIFLFWIYIVWLIVLSGVALSANIQKQFDPKA